VRRTVGSLALAGLVLLLGGCDENRPEQIEWQLPLEAPEDPHGGDQALTPPDWAGAVPGEAELVWLQKPTARLFTQTLALNGEADLHGWHVQLLGLASGLRVKNGAFLNDENVDNAAAFVRISRDGRTVYSGWLYASFPELFGLDDPEWKVWLKGIRLRPASTEAQ